MVDARDIELVDLSAKLVCLEFLEVDISIKVSLYRASEKIPCREKIAPLSFTSRRVCSDTSHVQTLPRFPKHNMLLMIHQSTGSPCELITLQLSFSNALFSSNPEATYYTLSKDQRSQSGVTGVTVPF